MIQELLEKFQKENTDCDSTNPQLKWDFLKYQIRRASIDYSKLKAKNRRNKFREFESKIKTIEEKQDWELCQELVEEHENLKKEF